MIENLEEKPNIAFGLQKDLRVWGDNKNAWSFGYDFNVVGISGISDFEEQFVQAVCNIRNNNGKIYFNLNRLDIDYIQITKDPNIIIPKNDIFSYTNFEIRNIVRNKDWFENTEWFIGTEKIEDLSI